MPAGGRASEAINGRAKRIVYSEQATCTQQIHFYFYYYTRRTKLFVPANIIFLLILDVHPLFYMNIV